MSRTALESTAYVWPVNPAHAPSYWFPGSALVQKAWVTTATTDADWQRILGPHTTHVHMIGYAWLFRREGAGRPSGKYQGVG